MRLHGTTHATTDSPSDPFATPGGRAFTDALNDMVLPQAVRERLEQIIEDAQVPAGDAEPAGASGDD